ncbi:hypothetical protein M0R72_00280 [Candidatus Pacearchaeota archaeon]|jgi:hypothetical protein|nr:hypothetical protein [Candidatus Pacearchaeota archaeon]
MDICEVKRRLFENHNGTVSIVDDTYVGFKQRAKFVDSEYGEWVSPVYAVCRGTRHPKRARVASRVSIQDMQTKIDERFGYGLILADENSFGGLTTECKFIDSEY